MNPFPQQVSKPPLKVKSSNLHVEEILDNNNLRKISIPNEGKNNLFKCLSFALFMSLKEELLIQTRLISQLKILIQEKRLSLKLSMFENDLMLFKDYCSNSHFHGFDKVSLELASHSFEIRIVVYSISEENYLNSTIYNNKFEKTISLLKTGTHFDVIVDNKKYGLLSFSQNLVYEFLFGVLGFQSLPNKPYFIAELESPYDDAIEMIFDRYDNTSPPHDNKLKPKHKKSRSDNFNIPNDKKDDNSTYYNLFLNYPAPKEFFANISPSNNSRFIKIFNSESEKSKDSIFKFPNESSLNFNQKEQRERSAEPSRDLSNLFPRQTKPPMFYVGTTPPGLTPNKNDFLKTTDEDSQIYQKKNQFKAPDQSSKISSSNNQLFDNILYKGDPNQNKYFPFQKQTFQDSEIKPFSIPKEEPTGLSNIPQKPDLNKGNPNFFYSNYISTPPQNFQNEEINKKSNLFETTAIDNKKTGRLKFFDEGKNYGFIIMDDDGSDIFVHYDDLAKAGVEKDLLRTAKQGNLIRFSFNCMNYIGKYNKSKKAVDLTLLSSFI